MKKFLLITSLLLLFCFNSNVFANDYIFNGEVVPSTSGMNDTFFGVETMRNILDFFEISYNESSLVSRTYYANEAMEDIINNYDSSIKAYNMMFYINVKEGFTMVPSNGSVSDTLPYVFTRFLSNWTTLSNITFSRYEDLSGLNNNGVLNIVLYESSYKKYWNDNTSYQAVKRDDTAYYDGSLLYSKYMLAPFPTYVVYGTVQNTNAGSYFIGNTFEFTKVEEPPSGGGSGSGEGGTIPDLSGISQGISDINNNLNNIENKIPSSGDIENAVTQGTVAGNQDFWGNSGDLTGEQQEELIEGKVDELIENISGDMAENEIFGILQNYENKLFGSFTGEEDFKISWQNISYMNKILIPSGEVNFSQMCRDNEALGRVKSTINIILGFFALMNCVIYLYNLFLATLGIDNPYLYEGRVGSVTVNEFTDENGRTTVTRTQHDGRGNSISRKYNHTIEPKKRQIGFRK